MMGRHRGATPQSRRAVEEAELLQPTIVIHSDVIGQAVAEIRDNPRIEVGGKFVGYVEGDFSAQDRDWRESFSRLRITIPGYLDAGPGRDRSAVHHHSDTDYQWRLFHRLAGEFPGLCFLGIWHSHHPNGLRELSGGDTETGRRTVNSDGHDLDLLLSSLAFDRRGLLGGRHFVFMRGHERFYEIDPGRVVVVNGDNPLAAAITRTARWLRSQPEHRPSAAGAPAAESATEPATEPARPAARPAAWLDSPEGRAALAFDQRWLSSYPSMRPALREGGVIWSGPIDVGARVFACAYYLPGAAGDPPVAEISAPEETMSLRFALADPAIRATRFASRLAAFSGLAAGPGCVAEAEPAAGEPVTAEPAGASEG